MKDSTPGQSLTYTKLHRPRVSRELVPRPDLLKRLNVQQELALLLAPAGYGKTTLLSTWLDTCDRPSAWLSLDENDNDLGVFTTYVATAVQKIFPTACTETLTLLNGITAPPSPVVARSLLNDLNAIPQEFILVLDDYHVIHEHSIHDLMTEVLRHPPRPLYLVLSARQDPPLPLASLRARGQVMQLRAADLRFSLKEAALLLQDVMKLAVDDRIVALLETKTEGWPAGLRLAGLSLLHKDGRKAIGAELDGYNRYVVDYLLTEVLSQLPMSVQEFLIKTSILDQLCGPLCEAVTGMHDRMFSGQTYLEWLEHADLFILSLDAEQHWYRYHPLFQQLLAHQLEQQYNPTEISALHAAASAWFAQHGFVEEALHHALVAGDMRSAVQIVAQQRHELMNQEQWSRMERWLHLFPRQVIDEQPDLLLSEVWIKLLRHELAEVPPILDRVEALIPHMALEPAAADRLQGEVEARRATQYYFAGDGTRSAIAAQRALEKLPTEWWTLRVRTLLFLSGGYLMAGDPAQAYATLYDSGEPNLGRAFQMSLLASACFVHWIAADLSGMAQAASQVLAWEEKLQHIESTTWSRYHLGLFHYQCNDLAEAEKCLTPIVLEPYLVHVICFVNSAVVLALINQARGQPEKAREIAAVMLSFALETRSTPMLSAAQAFQAELALRQGRLAEAGQWASHYQFPGPAPLPYFYAPPFTLARILLAQGTPASRQQAAEVLSQLHDYFGAVHNTWGLIEVLALQAMLHDADGDDECSLEALQQAIGLAEPGGFIRVFADLGPQIDPLLAELAQRGVAPTYIAEIRSALNDKNTSYEAARLENSMPASALKSSPILAEMLTNREMDVLLLLAKRLTNKEIALILGVSANTVKQHTSTLFQKLQVNDRRQAVAWARRNGLLPPI